MSRIKEDPVKCQKYVKVKRKKNHTTINTKINLFFCPYGNIESICCTYMLHILLNDKIFLKNQNLSNVVRGVLWCDIFVLYKQITKAGELGCTFWGRGVEGLVDIL